MDELKELIAWLREQLAEIRRTAEQDEETGGTWAAAFDAVGHKAALGQYDAHTNILDECERTYVNHISDDFTAYWLAENVIRTLGLAYQHREGYCDKWRP